MARQLIERASPAKVVFISLEADKETIDEARRCGHGYVFKPRLEPIWLPRWTLLCGVSSSPVTLGGKRAPGQMAL